MKPKAPSYLGNTRRRARCASGLMGERSRLQSRYENAETFHTYSRMYKLAERLGFTSEWAAWQANPVVESSVNPGDFRVVAP
jgi:hypothetical protein